MLNDGKNVQYVILEKRRPILVLKEIVVQQYLNTGLDAKTTQQRNLLQMEVLYRGVQRLRTWRFPVIIGLQITFNLLPQWFRR